jgi:hypothetical protein
MVSNKQPKALMLALGLESNGEGCSCHAYSAFECACDASWSEFYVKDAAAELRRLHTENEALRESLRTEELISFRRQMQGYAAQVERDEALLQQALAALEYASSQLHLIHAREIEPTIKRLEERLK